MKKRLAPKEEFEIMLLVLDKFLWVGFGVMLLGLFNLFKQSYINGILWMLSGVFLLVIFMIVIVKEYEIIA